MLAFLYVFLKFLPFASVTQSSDILFPSFISPSCLPSYFALCLFLNSTDMWYYNIFSALALNFTCLSYSYLSHPGERGCPSCAVSDSLWDAFLACVRELTVHHPQLWLLLETTNYSEVFSFSLLSLEQFFSNGKSLLPFSASSVLILKSIRFSGTTQHVTLSPPVSWFSSQCSLSSTITCFHWETQSSWTLWWVYVSSSISLRR